MNTNQFKDNASGKDAHLLTPPRPCPEARLVAKGGCIQLELVMPTDEEQDRGEARHETTQ